MTKLRIARLGVVLLGCAFLSFADDSKRSTEVRERLESATSVVKEIMGTPEKGIPQELLDRAECAVIIPGMKKGGFVVGAKYGKGFITCRGNQDRGWSAPANIRVEGGSFGLQIGGGEVDVFLLVMNEAGAKKLLQSEFKLGAEAGVMAGPVGRVSQAETDAYMRAQMLGWSRSRGAFAGLTLEGSTLREDTDDNAALYGKPLSNAQIVHGHTAVPTSARALVSALRGHSLAEKH